MSKNLKISLLTIFSAVILGTIIYLNLNNKTVPQKRDQVKVGESTFQVEVAKSKEERALGLSGRDGICENCGMLFVFQEQGRHPFWMMGMKFDLDIIWAKDGKVVKILQNVSHEKGTNEILDPPVISDRVLEIRAGKADQLGIKDGDVFESEF